MEHMTDKIVGNSINNPPGQFNYSIMNGKDRIEYTERPGYKAIEITKPDGSQEIFKSNFTPDAQHGKSPFPQGEYIKHTIDKNGQRTIKRSVTKPDWWPKGLLE